MAHTTAHYPAYDQLKADATKAAAADGNRPDPEKIRAAANIRRGPDWKACVLGHSNLPTLTELHMLLLADARDLNPPPPSWLAVARANRALQQDTSMPVRRLPGLDWDSLRQALPVPVTIAYSFAKAHWTQGAIHILLGEDLRSGRLQRGKGQALCTPDSTRARARHRYLHAAEGKQPTCKTCLEYAARLARTLEPAA